MPTKTTPSQTRKNNKSGPIVLLAVALFLAPCIAVVVMQSLNQPSGSKRTPIFTKLTEDNFSEIHAAIKPTDEKWKSIPWRTSLIDAQHDAVETEKPIFIWTMDGNPLGCT